MSAQPGDGGPKRRAYTDVLTGAMHLLDVPANALFKFLLKGRLPSIFLPSFLHESTHFWCMATDLGAALALRELRAHRAFDGRPYDRERLVNDLGVTNVAQQLLSPLLEGMALFQEFDAAPGRSSTLSSPGYWSTRLFRPLEAAPPTPEEISGGGEWLSSEIRGILIDYRLSRAGIHRKTSVLMRSLSNDEHQYLAGYLTVKRIWIHAAHRTRAFLDRDLFLTFLRDWIFQDWQLIDYVLDPEVSSGTAAYLISERLQNRLADLADLCLDEEAAIFDREMDSANKDDLQVLRALRQPEYVVLTAQQRMSDLLTDSLHGSWAVENENWAFGDAATLRHRGEMMRLAIEPVEIEVNEHDRVLVRKGVNIEDIYLAGQAPPGAERGTTPGWIAAYFLPAHLAVVVLAMRPNQPMLTVDVADLPAEFLNVLGFAITKVVAVEDARRKVTPFARKIASDLNDESDRLTLESLPGHVKEIYAGFATSGVPVERSAAVRGLLERKGLYDLLGKDGDLLVALTEMSLLPQPVRMNGLEGDHLRSSLSRSDIDFDVALVRIREKQDKSGLTLIETEGDLVWSLV
ncbi:MAG: hypothetical protein ACKVQW_03235 [Pyrinomonadaceae bacterium]